jgi:hypothetical protein
MKRVLRIAIERVIIFRPGFAECTGLPVVTYR